MKNYPLWKSILVILVIITSIIFAIPSIYRRQIFDPSTGVTKEGEYIQQPIMNLLNHNNIVGIDLDYNFKGDLEILTNRLSETIPWFPIEMFLNNKDDKDHLKFIDDYQKLISSLDFQNIFVFSKNPSKYLQNGIFTFP